MVSKAFPLASLAMAITLGPMGVSVSIASLCEVRTSSDAIAPSMHHASATLWLDGSTEAHSRITFEVITFEPLRVVRTDFTGFQWQHRAAQHEELIALSKA